MSLEFQAKLICDGCGAVLLSDIEHRSTRAAHILWPLVKEAEEERGWTSVSRGRSHTKTHWCKECSQKAMKPVSRKSRTIVENP
jgi:hypothetical protein